MAFLCLSGDAHPDNRDLRDSVKGAFKKEWWTGKLQRLYSESAKLDSCSLFNGDDEVDDGVAVLMMKAEVIR